MDGKMKLSESIVVDDDRDVLTVDGVPMSGELLRAIVHQSPPGVWYRTEVQDGVAKIHQRTLP